jgi:hypothetical protein
VDEYVYPEQRVCPGSAVMHKLLCDGERRLVNRWIHRWNENV